MSIIVQLQMIIYMLSTIRKIEFDNRQKELRILEFEYLFFLHFFYFHRFSIFNKCNLKRIKLLLNKTKKKNFILFKHSSFEKNYIKSIIINKAKLFIKKFHQFHEFHTFNFGSKEKSIHFQKLDLQNSN